jgi:hypothetical protein
MKRRPYSEHRAHVFTHSYNILSDIEGLHLWLYDEPDIKDRYQQSDISIMNTHNSDVYRLSSPCADYESENTPIAKEDNKYLRTNRHIFKSRQQIYCDVVGVPFIMDYDVKFSLEEEMFAEMFVSQLVNPIGVHLEAAEAYRSYIYKDWFIKELCNSTKSHVVVISPETYITKNKNEVVLSHKNIRYVWAVISKLKLLIGVDSFGVHAAGSTEVPVYGIFGPTDPFVRLQYKTVQWADNVPERKSKACRGRCWYNPCKIVGSRKKDTDIIVPCISCHSPKYYIQDVKKKYGGLL